MWPVVGAMMFMFVVMAAMALAFREVGIRSGRVTRTNTDSSLKTALKAGGAGAAIVALPFLLFLIGVAAEGLVRVLDSN